MLKLYDNLDSGNAYKVRLALAHLELAFERVALDTDSGETRTPGFHHRRYRAVCIHPRGR